MNWWWIASIIFLILVVWFIVFLKGSEEEGFIADLKTKLDNCCLGRIKRKIF